MYPSLTRNAGGLFPDLESLQREVEHLLDGDAGDLVDEVVIALRPAPGHAAAIVCPPCRKALG